MISVVIPHLNEPEDLARCLHALQAQRVENIPFEVIVIDNGSRISPEPLCQKYIGVRVASEATPGPGPARNRGAALAQGEIIAFIDADCNVLPGWLRAVRNHFEANSNTAFAGGAILVRLADPRRATPLELFDSIFGYLAQDYIERQHYAATGNMMVRKNVFEAVGPFLGIGIAEDREWGQRAHAQGHRGVYLASAAVDTPACKTFTELAKRWDRAVAHDFEEFRKLPLAGPRWVARSLMVGLSPPFEWRRILRSGKVTGLRDGLDLWRLLLKLRMHRARRMLALQLGAKSSPLVASWNRE